MEQQLPKYICEPCAGQLDIAYAFKRKYEDAIVKFVRQMSDHNEKEEESESGSSMTGDVPDSKQHETMHFNYSEINDLTVDDEFTVDDKKVKDEPQLIPLENFQPSDDLVAFTSDQTINGTQHEMAEHSSTCNESDLNYRSLPRAVLSKIYKYHYNRGSKPFQCDVCGRWFKTKGHIKTHRIRHIERSNRVKCNKCMLMFLTKPHFQKHRCSIKLSK